MLLCFRYLNFYTPMKYFSTVLLCLCSLCTFAQLQKGAMLFEGTLYFSRRSDDGGVNNYNTKTTNSSFRIDPKWGVMLNSKWMLGGVISLETGKTKNKIASTDHLETSEHTERAFGWGPFIRRYFSITEKLYLYGDLVTLYEISKNKYKNPNYDTNGSLIQVSLQGGVAYFINSRWGITSSFGSVFYSHSKTDRKNADSYTNSNYGISLQANTFSLGFQYYLRNKPME